MLQVLKLEAAFGRKGFAAGTGQFGPNTTQRTRHHCFPNRLLKAVAMNIADARRHGPPAEWTVQTGYLPLKWRLKKFKSPGTQRVRPDIASTLPCASHMMRTLQTIEQDSLARPDCCTHNEPSQTMSCHMTYDNI